MPISSSCSSRDWRRPPFGFLKKARSPADRSQVERQIGRLLERNRRAGSTFYVIVHEDPSLGSGLRPEWNADERSRVAN